MKSWQAGIITGFIIIAGVGIAQMTGLWEIEDIEETTIIFEGEYEGMADPEYITGSDTFGEIEVNFSVAAEVIAEAFSIEAENPSAIACRDLGNIFTDLPEDAEVGTGSIKLFVALYTGLPYISETDCLPESAVELLKEKNIWTDEMDITYGDNIIVLPSESYKFMVVAEEEHDETEGTLTEVKGSTTVKDLLDIGIELEDIESILTVKVENVNLKVRDICTSNELNFGTIKSSLNELIIALGDE